MVNESGIKIITLNNIIKLESLINNSGDALKTFRYYQNRPLKVINSHLLTIVYEIEGEPVAYGHLDLEDKKIWLGVMVIESRISQGYGKKILDYLISFITINKLKNIFLTVDQENLRASKIFKKYGFFKVGLSQTGTVLMKKKDE